MACMALIALNSVFMRFDVNNNFLENDSVHNVIFKNGVGEIFVSINTLLRIVVSGNEECAGIQ